MGESIAARWERSIRSLRQHLSNPGADEWTILSAFGLDDDSLRHARAEIDLIVQVADLAPGNFVVDLGSGSGRHLMALAERGIEGLGIEASTTLVEIAKRDARVPTHVGSICQPGLSGSADAVMCLSDTVGLVGDGDQLKRLLRSARGMLVDYRPLILQVSAWPDGAQRRPVSWADVDGLCLTEEIVPVDNHRRMHTFTLSSDGNLRSFRVGQYVPSLDDLEREIGDAGFKVSAVLRVEDGSTVSGSPTDGDDVLVVCAAVPGFNYLADLDDFLEAWADPDHPRNRRTVVEHRSDDGRYTNSGRARVGQGETLSKHHPQFAASLEPAIRPLVLCLVRDLNQISYSSCEGHQLIHPDFVATDAYIGLVGLTPASSERIERLLRSMGPRHSTDAVTVGVRRRLLHGVTSQVEAVDLVLGRPHQTDWDQYRRDLAGVVNGLVDEIHQTAVMRDPGPSSEGPS